MTFFERLDVEVIRAAEQQGTTPDHLRKELCRRLAEAARAHFGENATFEAQFEGGALQLLQFVRVTDAARLRARDLDVEEGDQLAFEVPLLETRKAAQRDREWGWLTGIVTANSGFGAIAIQLVRDVLRLPVVRDARTEAVKRAVLLAVLPAGSDLERTRIVQATHGGLQLRRRYTVGKHVTRDEVKALLECELRDGSAFELFEDMVTTERLLVGLVDPEVRAVARAATDCAVAEADVIAELKSVGIDLVERKLEGRPWTNLDYAMKHSWMELKVVEKVSAPYGEISLAHAKLIDPACALGTKLKLPGGIDRGTSPDLVRLFADDDSVRSLEARGVTEFETQRPTAVVQPTPPALLPFELGPLRLLHAEGHGVLFADVPGAAALSLWRRLDAAAASTGFRPVLLGGDPGELRGASSGWARESPRTLQAGAHPNDSPQAVLRAAESVDVAALLAPGGNPSYPDLLPERGDWPDGPSGDQVSALHDALEGEPYAKVRLALVPVDAAWKTLAYLPLFLDAGEATPSMAQACAVSREWERKFGAKVISVRPATIEWWLDHPPSRSVALELAPEHFTFTPEGGSNVLEVRANELVSPVWTAWWD